MIAVILLVGNTLTGCSRISDKNIKESDGGLSVGKEFVYVPEFSELSISLSPPDESRSDTKGCVEVNYYKNCKVFSLISYHSGTKEGFKSFVTITDIKTGVQSIKRID